MVLYKCVCTLGLANQVIALNDPSRRMRSARSQGRHGGGGEIADMAVTCGGSRDPRTSPNLLAASAAAFPTGLPELSRQIRSNARQSHSQMERDARERRASKGRAKPWSRGRRGGRLGAAGLGLGEVVELVHGLLEAPLRVGADVPTSASAGGHRGGWRGVGDRRWKRRWGGDAGCVLTSCPCC